MTRPDRPARTPPAETSGLTSTSLLERVKSEDQDAWRKLVDLYGPLVYQWCRRWQIPPADTHDVVQEVFRDVASSVVRFRHDRAGDTFRGWLWAIARNEARDHFVRRENRPLAIGGSELQARLSQIPERPPEDPSDPQASGEMTGLMHRALNVIRGDFQQQTWQAFWHTAVDGRAAVDVARDLGMTSRAVRQAKHRVLKRLREELRDLVH